MAEKPTTLEQWKWDKLSEPDFAREYVAQLESSLADANKALKLVEDHGLLAIVNELEAALAEARRENEKLQELKNFCYAEAQTQGDGRDFSLAAYMLRDLPTTKRAELTELCQAMSNETASKSDWEGLKQWWLEAALKAGDDDAKEVLG